MSKSSTKNKVSNLEEWLKLRNKQQKPKLTIYKKN